MRPLIWAFATTPKDCGEHLTYALLNAQPGMDRRGEKGDAIGELNLPPATEEQKLAFWEHSVESVKGKLWYVAVLFTMSDIADSAIFKIYVLLWTLHYTGPHVLLMSRAMPNRALVLHHTRG